MQLKIRNLKGKSRVKLSMHLDWAVLKKSWLHLSLVACFAIAVFLLMFLDYFNLEKISFFNTSGFLFDVTWKGRLFLFFFFWLFIVISFLEFKSLGEIIHVRRNSHIKLLIILLCALFPLFYIIGVNFLGLDQPIIQMGEALRGEYWRANIHSSWENFLTGDWPLSIEYLVFTLSFVATTFLTFGKKGLKTFSLAIALISGITVVYMIDTIYPYGAFGPLQTFALPTAACAAVLLQMLGIPLTLSFSSTNPGSMPVIAVNAQGSLVSASVAWPCAGVHSLFLYTVLILLLLGSSEISGFRKIIYFIVGLIGTFFVNVLRIVTYFVLLVGQGRETALTFHGVYGELYFFTWMLGYLLLILGIQRYSIVERLEEIFLRSKQGAGSTE